MGVAWVMVCVEVGLWEWVLWVGYECRCRCWALVNFLPTLGFLCF